MARPPSGQLGLPIMGAPGLGEFIPAASNAEARAWLDRPADWPEGRLALYGDEGTGKTHLLCRFAQRHGARVHHAPPADPPSPLVIDAADSIADAAALLHSLNRARDAGALVLLAGRTPPASWPVTLPDLASRLRAITAVAIAPADDALLRLLLARLLAERQLTLREEHQAWLLATQPRHGAALREAVARIDAAALAQGGRIDRAVLRAASGGQGALPLASPLGCATPDRHPSPCS